jgi:TolB-like protein/Flp pilus assembly protein TadD
MNVPLFSELKRRNVIRTGLAYLAASWLVFEVLSAVMGVFGAPDWAIKSLVAVLAIGLPFALVLAWVYEITPEGVRKTSEVDESESLSHSTGRRMDYMIVLLLIVGISIVAFDRFRPSEPATRSQEPTAVSASESAPAPEPQAKTPPNSIAVLAFRDMSPNKDQEYLSDGVAEEILNALVRIDGLKVAGRTSAFSFKGKEADLRSIGEALQVAHLLDGSVRKQGEQVRISAQLVKAADGFQLWSESYDGDLADIFSLQERIAQSVARKLEVTLSSANRNRLSLAGTENVEAYELYLRADSVPFGEAAELLGHAVELDPGFSRAYSERAMRRLLWTQGADQNQLEAWPLVERDIEAALRTDPDNAMAYGARGFLYYLQRRFVEMEPAFRRGLAINPNDPDLLYLYQTSLLSMGQMDKAYETVSRLVEIEPLSAWYHLYKGFAALFLGRKDEARQQALRANELGPTTYKQILGWLAAEEGDVEKAARLTAESWEGFEIGLDADETLVAMRGAFGTEQDKAAAVAVLDAALERRTALTQHRMLPMFYMAEGAYDKALELFYTRPDPTDEVLYGRIWSELPAFVEFRRSARMQDFAERTGLLAYWLEYGWPNGCRPVEEGSEQFVCD